MPQKTVTVLLSYAHYLQPDEICIFFAFNSNIDTVNECPLKGTLQCFIVFQSLLQSNRPATRKLKIVKSGHSIFSLVRSVVFVASIAL